MKTQHGRLSKGDIELQLWSYRRFSNKELLIRSNHYALRCQKGNLRNDTRLPAHTASKTRQPLLAISYPEHKAGLQGSLHGEAEEGRKRLSQEGEKLPVLKAHEKPLHRLLAQLPGYSPRGRELRY